MQQQVHSYAFQLRQDSVCTSVSSHPYQLQFYSTVIRNKNPEQSIIYKLNYSEDQPRKSQINSVSVHEKVNSIKCIGFGNQNCKIFLSSQKRNNKNLRIINNQIFQKPQFNLQELNNFYTTQNTIKDIQKGKDNNVYISLDNQVCMIDPNKAQNVESIIKAEQSKSISHTAIDPAKGYLTYCIQNVIHVHDKASKTQKYSFKVCPQQGDNITNIDYNPNKQFYLMTAHHDFMKFWDIRKTNIPIKTVEDHHSLLLKAIYNHAHDQLILGCYDDGTVGLYRMPSVSSSPSGEGSDALVKLYDEHEDSVYHACWGHSPWVFGSVSYSATNMVINIVPSVQKYRILL